MRFTTLMLIPYFVYLFTSAFRSVNVSSNNETRTAYYVSTAEFALRYTFLPMWALSIIISNFIDPTPGDALCAVIATAVVAFFIYRNTHLEDKNYWFHGRFSDGRDPWFLRVLRRRRDKAIT